MLIINIFVSDDAVVDPPLLITKARDQVKLEGGPAINLTRTADGEPAPDITWTTVFSNVSDSDVLSTGEQFILLNNRTNDGTYRCKASNGIGNDVNNTVDVVVNCEYVKYSQHFEELEDHCLNFVTNVFCCLVYIPSVLHKHK